MRRLLACFAVIVFCAAAAQSARAEMMQLVVDGTPRSYLLERPKAKGPSPTIIMLHGAGGTAERIAQITGLAQQGLQQGFAPQSLEIFRSHGGPPNDIGFLKMLVADLVRRGVSDPTRVYLAGLSNGGFMTLTMFCTQGGLFAGIGLIVSSMDERTGEECRPARPLPVVILNGTADMTVPYRGGLVAPLDRNTPSTLNVWSTDRLALYFRRLNGCPRDAEASVLSGQRAEKIEVERSTNCSGAPMTVYRVIGGTHGSTPVALNSGKLLLDFFRENSPATVTLARAPPPTATAKIVNFAYRRFDGPTLVTGDVRRTGADQWLETNTRGSRWTFRTTAETSSEVILHDVSRDIYVMMDMTTQKMFVRKGIAQPWALLADIVGTEKK